MLNGTHLVPYTCTTSLLTDASMIWQSSRVTPVQWSIITVLSRKGCWLAPISLSTRTRDIRRSPSIKLSTQRIVFTVRSLSRISVKTVVMLHEGPFNGLYCGHLQSSSSCTLWKSGCWDNEIRDGRSIVCNLGPYKISRFRRGISACPSQVTSGGVTPSTSRFRHWKGGYTGRQLVPWCKRSNL